MGVAEPSGLVVCLGIWCGAIQMPPLARRESLSYLTFWTFRFFILGDNNRIYFIVLLWRKVCEHSITQNSWHCAQNKCSMNVEGHIVHSFIKILKFPGYKHNIMQILWGQMAWYRNSAASINGTFIGLQNCTPFACNCPDNCAVATLSSCVKRPRS